MVPAVPGEEVYVKDLESGRVIPRRVQAWDEDGFPLIFDVEKSRLVGRAEVEFVDPTAE